MGVESSYGRVSNHIETRPTMLEWALHVRPSAHARRRSLLASRPHIVRVLVAAALIGSVLALAACGSQGAESTSATKNRLRVSGSGTCLPLLRILSDQYTQDVENIEFVYLPGLHSGGGIRGAAGGELELGAVSRELTDEESGLGLKYVKLSDDGLVVATHSSVDVRGITSEQLRGVYSGAYTNWTELGGPDLPIVILDRNEDESAKIILRQYVLGPDLEITDRAINLFYEPDMVDALQTTRGAIGYFSLGLGLSEEIPVNYLDLDGVEPSVETVEDRTYRMVRPLGIVAKTPLSDDIAAFLDWSVSQEAVALMRERGFAPSLDANDD